MAGYITADKEQDVYRLYIDGESKPHRIYSRNHHCTYIKLKNLWVRVYFNHWLISSGSFAQIPMILNADDEWEQEYRYEQLPVPGAVYALVE